MTKPLFMGPPVLRRVDDEGRIRLPQEYLETLRERNRASASAAHDDRSDDPSLYLVAHSRGRVGAYSASDYERLLTELKPGSGLEEALSFPVDPTLRELLVSTTRRDIHTNRILLPPSITPSSSVMLYPAGEAFIIEPLYATE